MRKSTVGGLMAIAGTIILSFTVETPVVIGVILIASGYCFIVEDRP